MGDERSLGDLPLFRALRELQERRAGGDSSASKSRSRGDVYNPLTTKEDPQGIRHGSGRRTYSDMHLFDAKSGDITHIGKMPLTRRGRPDLLALYIMRENASRQSLHTLGEGIFHPVGLATRDRKPTLLESKKRAIVDSIYNTIWNNTNMSRSDNMAATRLTAGPSPFLLQGCVSYSHMDVNDENVGGGGSNGAAGQFQFHESFQASNIDNTNILGLSLQDAAPEEEVSQEEAEDAFYGDDSWEENAMYIE